MDGNRDNREGNSPQESFGLNGASNDPGNLFPSSNNLAAPVADESSTQISEPDDNTGAPDVDIDENDDATDAETTELAPISWTASESIDHARSKGWHLAVLAVGAALIALIGGLMFLGIFTIFSAISTGFLVVVAITALIVVSRQPVREIHYSITGEGIEIAGQLHGFDEFRAFSVRRLGAMWELVLIPIKRFGMENTMFINEDQGEQIVDELGEILPMEETKNSFVDNLAHKLKL